jgi:hypothetical protein
MLSQIFGGISCITIVESALPLPMRMKPFTFCPFINSLPPYTKRISCTAKFCLLAKSCLTFATVCQLKHPRAD